MTSITTRTGKGSPLTHNEVDANFTNLNTDKLDTAGIALGSAASPTIKFTGDPNTGIYSPGADQLAISTNGTGRLFIDSNGTIRTGNAVSTGVGATTNECFIKLGEQRTGDGPSYLAIYGQAAASSFNFTRYGGANGVAEITNQGSGNINLATLGAGALLFTTNNTERLRIDSSGRLGLGVSSPTSLLHLADAGNITVGTTTGTKIGTATTQKIGFYNATPVVQPTAVADATDAATVITQLNALLTRMRNLGLIAT
jgi:hypothetical protein